MQRLRTTAILSATLLAATVAAGPASAAAGSPVGARTAAVPTLSIAVQLAPASGTDPDRALAAMARTPLAADPAARVARSAELARLAPPRSHELAVTAFAAAHGLQVSYASRWLVVLRGPGSALAGLFGTRLTTTSSTVARGKFFRPVSNPRIPAVLDGSATSVVGLDNAPLLRPAAIPTGYTGTDLREAYQQASSPADGTGVTVGTVQFSGWNSADLSTYAQAAGIPLAAGQVQSVSVNGASTTTVQGGGDTEVDLDTESILAVAPAADQRVYVTTNDLTGMLAVYDEMATDAAAGLVQVVSQSWGDCEQDFTGNTISQLDSALARIVSSGATVFASTGDTGAYDCPSTSSSSGQLAVDYPASSPYVVGVGGTSLTGSGSSWSETAWPGGGGGTSTIEARPSWQSGVGIPGSYRLVPDVSSDADPNTGLGVYIPDACPTSTGGWCLGGGTSLASPTWAAGLADALSSAGRVTGLGDIHAVLYANPQDFRDITSGSNGPYSAGPGYDEVTGLGSPDWSALTGALLPQSPASLLSSAGSGQQTAVGTGFAQPLTAEVTTAAGSPVPGTKVTFSLPTTGADATFVSGAATASAVTDAQGLATSPAIIAGSQAGTLQATAEVQESSRTISTSFALVDTDPARTQQSAAPSLAAVAGGNQLAVVAEQFGTPLQVRVLDSSGAGVPAVAVTFTTPTAGPTATFPTGHSVTVTTDSTGLATAPTLTAGQQAGAYQVLAATPGVSSALPMSLSNTAGAPAHLQVVSGNNAATVIGTAFATVPVVAVTDSFGNPVPAVPVQFTGPAAGPSATVNPDPALTSAAGLARPATMTANLAGGFFHLQVSAGAVSASLTLDNLIGAPGRFALASSDLSVPVAWRASNGDTELSSFDGVLSPAASLGGQTPAAPAVAVYGSGLAVAVTGTTGGIYLGWRNPGWSGWQRLAGQTNAAPALASRGGQLFLAVRGTNNQMYLRSYASGVWSPWRDLGGGFASAPSLAVSPDGQVLVVGLGWNHATYLGTLQNNRFSGWRSLGGWAVSSPGVAVDPVSGMAMVAVRGGNWTTYVRTLSSSGWTGWRELGGRTPASPGVAALGGNRFLVSVTAGPRTLYLDTWTGAGWTGWAQP